MTPRLNHNMNIDGSDIITQYVSKFEKGIPNSVYNKCIREMAQVNLARIEEREVKQIIEEYLYVWGKMGRVVGQNINWQSDLTKTIRQKAKILEIIKSIMTDWKVEQITCQCQECKNVKYELIERDKILRLIERV